MKFLYRVKYFKFLRNKDVENFAKWLEELSDKEKERIIQGLKIESGVNIEPENTLIIFDEVQETPKALTALKYFCENANKCIFRQFQ